LALELADAARRQSVTDLNRHFAALEGLGELERRLATHLRDLGRDFKMDAIRTVIAQLNTP
jgi:hypothetical protein